MLALQQAPMHDDMTSNMLMVHVGSATLMSMAQAFPIYSEKHFYVTQPAIMSNFSSKNYRTVFRSTLNFEPYTQRHGEISYGAWGESYIDKRHPHTLLHELMLSYNLGDANKGFSLSAGKGFAPYGTDDPMSRPVVKYPTNHHLSQILERWVVEGIYAYKQWGVEAGLFDGTEPSGPFDLENFHHFGNSWSVRVTHRVGEPMMRTWPWELSASYGSVKEVHETDTRSRTLQNVAVRHEHDHGNVHMFALAEASRSHSLEEGTLFSILGEGSLGFARSTPYGRVEYARRPEWPRQGVRGEDDFFRYNHDDWPTGATRWLILTAGYGYSLGTDRISPRPFVEVQHNSIGTDVGGIDPRTLYGKRSFWSISLGMRIFIGGESMRMGTYGVFDPMTAMHTMPMSMHDMNGM